MENSFWKGRKITAYVALKHHTRFIIPIMEKLADLGAETSYLVGQAERSQEITAIETGLNYTHIFDYVNASDKVDKASIYKNYKMLRTTFAKTMMEDRSFGLLVPTVLDKTLFAVAQEYTGFQNYLEKNKPDICLSLHELNRWGKLFSFHSKQKGIPHIILQEGLLTSAAEDMTYVLTGHVQNSTLCLVWGESTRKKLMEFEAPGDRIIPTGNTHLANEIKYLSENNIRQSKRREYKVDKRVVVTLFCSINLPKGTDEFHELMTRLGNSKDTELFIKFHPGTVRTKINEWLAGFPKAVTDKIHSIHGEEDTYCLIAMSDLCVLVEASTVGPEALAIGIPLVLLNLKADVVYKDTSMVEKGAALQLTVDELCRAVLSKDAFTVNHQGVKAYLDSELTDTQNSINRVVDIMKRTVQANQSPFPIPIASNAKPDKDWTVIIPVTPEPDLFLSTLEQVSLSSGEEDYEVILLLPPSVTDGINAVLDSLGGDVHILENKGNTPLSTMMNLAAEKAKGRTLVFLNKYLAPERDWLGKLRTGQEQFGHDKIFGGKISNRFGNIVHAGMVVNPNGQPVSAYLHLDKNFPQTCKTRPFQMVDHFIGIQKNIFLESGGFHPEAGPYRFLDLCLRTNDIREHQDAVVYLHESALIQLSGTLPSPYENHAICFYGKWNDKLWENEDILYSNDGLSSYQLAAARLTRAQELANLL